MKSGEVELTHTSSKEKSPSKENGSKSKPTTEQSLSTLSKQGKKHGKLSENRAEDKDNEVPKMLKQGLNSNKTDPLSRSITDVLNLVRKNEKKSAMGELFSKYK